MRDVPTETPFKLVYSSVKHLRATVLTMYK